MDPSSLFPTASTKVFQRIDVECSELFERVIFVLNQIQVAVLQLPEYCAFDFLPVKSLQQI